MTDKKGNSPQQYKQSIGVVSMYKMELLWTAIQQLILKY
jgi:hypothetical protein